MPIYEYQCTECGHQLEAIQRMNDPKLTDCDECKKPSLKKQLTAAAFKLKGTGWYETDFKNSGQKPQSAKTPQAVKSKGGNTANGTNANNQTDVKSSNKSVTAE